MTSGSKMGRCGYELPVIQTTGVAYAAVDAAIAASTVFM